ncbi:hypothetical protein FRC20_006079 [Serendipita sp. 405]|nr:hypothetical protein FRC15_006198 [Serendipita sp. 397]KAG8839244.1 hypothetical protein FRC20_006079 [Serendipita sp. 405]
MSNPSSVIAKAPDLSHLTIRSSTRIATLWSNYGSIDRVHLKAPSASVDKGMFMADSVIIKTVSPPQMRGTADEGHLRKLLSYEVERWFYQHLSHRLPATAKVAKYFPIEGETDETLPLRIVLEDLAKEYPNPARGSLALNETQAVLSWLAAFHGTFRGIQEEDHVRERLVPPPLLHKEGDKKGVWTQGTYWYLDTRREELESVDESEYAWLLKWVEKVDSALKDASEKYGTLLHGDVKGANIVFAPTMAPPQQGSSSCALYDLQYAGVGVVTRDLVYFLGTTAQSGLTRRIEQEKELLKHYHSDLLEAIASRRHPSPQEPDRGVPLDDGEYGFERLWEHWELAIVDWYRFMAGWGFWGNDTWVERRAKEIVGRWEESGFPYVR